MERLNYVDYARGLAILLVVIGHLCRYNFEGDNAKAVFYFIYSFHMPLFFFLSGYVVMMSRASLYDYKSFILRKMQTLLIPFFCWCLFADIIQMEVKFNGVEEVNRLIQLLADPQTGAWFLIVLFCIQIYFIIGIVISKVVNKIVVKDSLSEVISFALVAVILSVISHVVGGSIYISLQYFIMFIVGYLFKRLFDGNLNQFALLICFLLYSFLWKEWNGINNSVVLRLVVSITISLIIIHIFKKVSLPQNRAGFVILNSLQYFGRHTFDIYLTHSFFFFMFYESVNVDKIYPTWFFLILLFLAIPIFYVSIIFASAIKHSNILALLLYGKSQKK